MKKLLKWLGPIPADMVSPRALTWYSAMIFALMATVTLALAHELLWACLAGAGCAYIASRWLRLVWEGRPR